MRQQPDKRVPGFVDLNRQQMRLDALGPPGGTGGVQHLRAARLIGQSWSRRGQELVVRQVTGDRATERIPALHLGNQVEQSLGQFPHTEGGYDYPGAAVPQDVGRLVCRQMPVHSGDVQPGT